MKYITELLYEIERKLNILKGEHVTLHVQSYGIPEKEISLFLIMTISFEKFEYDFMLSEKDFELDPKMLANEITNTLQNIIRDYNKNINKTEGEN